MTEKRFRVNELGKYHYSEIGEYIDENHTDIPLRNDILVELLNELHEEKQHLQRRCGAMEEEIECLSEENEQLKQQIQTILKLTKKIEDCTHDIQMIGDVE